MPHALSNGCTTDGLDVFSRDLDYVHMVDTKPRDVKEDTEKRGEM